MIEVTKVVKIHFVIPDDDGELFDAHTHGLEAFGHPEFQVLVPGFCRSAAGSVLNNHADMVINRGERFRPGELAEIGGAIVGYVEVPGDFAGDPTRLCIVDLPSEHEFNAPRVRLTKFGGAEGN